jgi:hypothetical protein
MSGKSARDRSVPAPPGVEPLPAALVRAWLDEAKDLTALTMDGRREDVAHRTARLVSRWPDLTAQLKFELRDRGLSPRPIEQFEHALLVADRAGKKRPDVLARFQAARDFLRPLRASATPGGPPTCPADRRIARSLARTQWLAQALLLLHDHPEWSDADIAAQVGKHPSTLSRDRTYRQAAAQARAAGVRRPLGFRDPGTGDLEAVDDS